MLQTRKLTIIAQDPSVLNRESADKRRKILTTTVSIPYEKLDLGPRGYRVHVVDYDATQRVLYHPFDAGSVDDTFEDATDHELLTEPAFHAQNVYAIVMRLLARFEAALGRRISWGFGSHQIHVVPHAFVDANAFYSDDAQGLFFGYFPDESGNPVYTCLSHDVVAHEATHALIDGLRASYTLPSHPDQAGFHEGFADIAALLSVFGLPDVVRSLLILSPGAEPGRDKIKKEAVSVEKFKNSVLMGLAEQFGQQTTRHRENCLRRAVKRPPDPEAMKDIEFEESHLRGEILSAAVLNSFIRVWSKRLKQLFPDKDGNLPLSRVVEDGVDAADQLLTMCIRALDYCPVVDITFSDFLSSLLTADFELIPDDSKYKYRDVIRSQFKAWGIEPSSGTPHQVHTGAVPEIGIWEKAFLKEPLTYEQVHREPLERNRDEVFHFLWENRGKLGVYEHAYTSVISVRPCMRVAPDGFILRETVSEYRQTLDIEARQLKSIHREMEIPERMTEDTKIRLRGGGVLIFDEFGHLKYHIHSHINNPERQNRRLKYLWKNKIKDSERRYGFTDGTAKGERFAARHELRDGIFEKDEWG